MLRLIGKIVRSRIATPVLLAAVAWQGWMLVRPKPFPLGKRREAMAERAAANLAQQLPAPASGRPTLMVTRFESDTSGFVTDAVRRAIDVIGLYAVRPPGTVENLLRELGFEEKAPSADEVAKQDPEKLGADYVLTGRVEKLSATDQANEALLEALLIPVGVSGLPVRLRATAEDLPAQARVVRTVRSYPWPARVLSWLALALLLPLALLPLTDRILAIESNAVNLAALSGLTLVSGLAAFALIGFTLETWRSAALLAGAVALAFAYNWFILSKQEQLRT